MFHSIILTDDEMAALDDGQDWYTPGDTVYLGGYLPETDDQDAALDLEVAGVTHDAWTTWKDLSPALQARLRAAESIAV